LPAKGYASHGQSWSIAIALRLAAFKTLREHDDDPILILDDVFAELDEKRRTRLISIISNVEQTLITAAVIEDIPKGLPSKQLLLEDN
jgi:DNA replication and repair protein RecF